MLVIGVWSHFCVLLRLEELREHHLAVGMDVGETTPSYVVSLVAEMAPIYFGSTFGSGGPEVSRVHQLNLGLVVLGACLEVGDLSNAWALAKMPRFPLEIRGAQMAPVLVEVAPFLAQDWPPGLRPRLRAGGVR